MAAFVASAGLMGMYLIGLADVLLIKVVASVRRRGGRCIVVFAGRRMKRCCSGVVAGSGATGVEEGGKGKRKSHEEQSMSLLIHGSLSRHYHGVASGLTFR